jgi:hypothetical protein
MAVSFDKFDLCLENNHVYYLKNLDQDKELMQIQIPKQLEALTVSLNEDQVLISGSKNHPYYLRCFLEMGQIMSLY